MDNKVILGLGLLTAIIFVGGFYLLIPKNQDETSEEVSIQKQAEVTESAINNQESEEIIENNEGDTMGENIVKTYNSAPEMQIDVTKTYKATMKTTKGDMTLELFASENPITVNNFVFLARDGFYDETKFHRIMKDFMIQGGDPLGTGTGSPGYRFDDEPVTRDYNRGIIAMANSGVNTNGSQFFIMHANYPLPQNYIIFGQVTEGFEVLDSIANTKVKDNGFGELSQPTENILINSIEIIEE